jgi:hypothetical protein
VSGAADRRRAVRLPGSGTPDRGPGSSQSSTGAGARTRGRPQGWGPDPGVACGRAPGVGIICTLRVSVGAKSAGVQARRPYRGEAPAPCSVVARRQLDSDPAGPARRRRPRGPGGWVEAHLPAQQPQACQSGTASAGCRAPARRSCGPGGRRVAPASPPDRTDRRSCDLRCAPATADGQARADERHAPARRGRRAGRGAVGRRVGPAVVRNRIPPAAAGGGEIDRSGAGLAAGAYLVSRCGRRQADRPASYDDLAGACGGQWEDGRWAPSPAACTVG